MKLLIVGHGRHGKDTMAEILNQKFGISFLSSSQAACDKFIYNELKDIKGYSSIKECFEDRINNRDYWYNRICEYNLNDRARLAKDIVGEADCYVGMRDYDEFKECLRQEIFDLIIWVDASDRLPLESGSFNIPKSDVDIIVDNNGTLEEFVNKVERLGRIILTKNLVES